VISISFFHLIFKFVKAFVKVENKNCRNVTVTNRILMSFNVYIKVK